MTDRSVPALLIRFIKKHILIDDTIETIIENTPNSGHVGGVE
jgi:hypothetical protein